MGFENLYILKKDISQVLNQLELVKFNSNLQFYNITQVQSLFLTKFIKFKLLLLNSQDLKQNFNILEFGSSNGYSLLSMLLGIVEANLSCSNSIEDLQHYSLIGFEIDKFRFDEINKNVSSFSNLLNLKVYNEDMFNFHKIFQNKLNNSHVNSFDIIFIDCNQEFYEEVILYVLKYDLLSLSGSILLENTLSHKKSFNFLTSLKEFEFEIFQFPLHNGFIEIKLIHKK